MAERKASPPRRGASGSGTAAAKVEGSGSGAGPDPTTEEQPPAEDDGKVEVRAGGFVTRVDPPPPSPDPIIPCSVCGSTLVDDRCPRGHGADSSGGWQIPED